MYDEVSYAEKLWPKWMPTTEVIQLWVERLGKFDEQLVHRALDNYKTKKGGSYNSPKLHDVIELVRLTASPNTGGNDPTVAYSIRCVEHEYERRVGQVFKFWTKKENENWQESANQTRNKMEQIYGGRWAVVWNEANCPVPF